MKRVPRLTRQMGDWARRCPVQRTSQYVLGTIAVLDASFTARSWNQPLIAQRPRHKDLT